MRRKFYTLAVSALVSGVLMAAISITAFALPWYGGNDGMTASVQSTERLEILWMNSSDFSGRNAILAETNNFRSLEGSGQQVNITSGRSPKPETIFSQFVIGRDSDGAGRQLAERGSLRSDPDDPGDLIAETMILREGDSEGRQVENTDKTSPTVLAQFIIIGRQDGEVQAATITESCSDTETDARQVAMIQTFGPKHIIITI